MKIVNGDLWQAQANVIAVTTNAVITQDLKLVMGAGAAKQMLDRYPGIDAEAAEKIVKQTNPRRYGFLVIRPSLAIFQTKGHFRADSDPELIELSVETLLAYTKKHPTTTIAVNFPGIGLGNLTPRQVKPIIGVLPDTVTFYWR